MICLFCNLLLALISGDMVGTTNCKVKKKAICPISGIQRLKMAQSMVSGKSSSCAQGNDILNCFSTGEKC